MKKLIKSDICGSVNSAWMYCSQFEKVSLYSWKQKKKKTETRFAPKHERKTRKPNIHVVSLSRDGARVSF